MSIESETIWFDGEMVPFHEANVHVLAHTLHYGMGAFEGIRAYEQPDGTAGVWCLYEHLERFLNSMKTIQVPTCPYSMEELGQACLQTLQANHFRTAYLRPLAFLGMGKMGLGARDNPLHVIIAAWLWGAYLGEEALKAGVRLKTSSLIRNHPNAVMQRSKVVGHYVNNILARYEANDDGYDEALMLDHNGYVAEGTGENVFVVQNGVVYTPPEVNILPGITRQSVLEILRHEGIAVREELFPRDLFYTGKEAFFCGTAAEVTPIREVDRRTVGDGRPGPITTRVQSLYLEAVAGRVPWLEHHITKVVVE
jgi:branched-chain amino acid aminotransferase